MKLFRIVLLGSILCLFACAVEGIKVDRRYSDNSVRLTSGEKFFSIHCKSCHNFNADGIGPNLSGLTREVDYNWILAFIKDPKSLIDKGDSRSVSLFGKYKTYMPGFEHLSEEELSDVLSYLHTFDAPILDNVNKQDFLENPIVDSIEFAEEVLMLESILQLPATQQEFPLTRINKTNCEKNSGRLFINDLRGQLYEVVNGQANLYLSLHDFLPHFTAQPGLGTGFGSFAFHPDFNANGHFYTTHTETPNSAEADFPLPDSIPVVLQWVVTEWTSSDKSNSTFKGVHRELLRINVGDGFHGMQDIAFDPTVSSTDEEYGLLHICMGDGGSVLNGQHEIVDHNGNGVLGTILRINPAERNSTNGEYGIPRTNPFYKIDKKMPEVFAYGFRNPNKITWDRQGRLLVSGIGQAQIEELNAVVAGSYYGWPFREGSFAIDPTGDISKVYELPKNDDKNDFVHPFLQYDHDEGRAISGGYVGENVWQDKYLFGDIPTGFVFVADLTEGDHPSIKKLRTVIDGEEITFEDKTGHPRIDLRFGQGCDGSMYLFTKADGRLYHVIDDKNAL